MEQSASILIVDDLPVNIEVISSILGKQDYEIHFVLSGKDALELLQQRPFDLILLDIKMPELDGYNVCRMLKSNEATKNIPVIFLSAMSSESDVVLGFEVGGVDYVTKPFKAEELLARVKTQIALGKAREHRSLLLASLQSANEELERMIHTVSHDLKAPLHSIRGYASYIRNDLLAGKPPTRAIQDAERIICIAEQTTELVLGLLEVSRAGKRQQTIAPFGMEDLLRDILEDFKPKLEEVQAEITLQGTWPSVNSDQTQIRQVWQNYIQNALKYRDKQRAPHLVFFCQETATLWQFGLKDKGIGIPPADLKKVFNLFEKLDQKSEGSGLGLSIVKKIIESLQGQVWAESEGLGQGSCFYFSLPKNLSSL